MKGTVRGEYYLVRVSASRLERQLDIRVLAQFYGSNGG